MHTDHLSLSGSVESGCDSLFPDEYGSYKEDGLFLHDNQTENSIIKNNCLLNSFEDFINLNLTEWLDFKPSWVEEDVFNRTHEEHAYSSLSKKTYLETYYNPNSLKEKLNNPSCSDAYSFTEESNYTLFKRDSSINKKTNYAETDYKVPCFKSEESTANNDNDCLMDYKEENVLASNYIQEIKSDASDIFVTKDGDSLKYFFNFLADQNSFPDDDDLIYRIVDFDILSSFFNDAEGINDGFLKEYDDIIDMAELSNGDYEEIDIIHDEDGDVCSEVSASSSIINGKRINDHQISNKNQCMTMIRKSVSIKKGKHCFDNTSDDYADDDWREKLVCSPKKQRRMQSNRKSFRKIRAKFNSESDYGGPTVLHISSNSIESLKRLQNKEAAMRYRQKKKQTESYQQDLIRLLVLRNEELKRNITNKELQIQKIKDLFLND